MDDHSLDQQLEALGIAPRKLSAHIEQLFSRPSNQLEGKIDELAVDVSEQLKEQRDSFKSLEAAIESQGKELAALTRQLTTNSETVGKELESQKQLFEQKLKTEAASRSAIANKDNLVRSVAGAAALLITLSGIFGGVVGWNRIKDHDKVVAEMKNKTDEASSQLAIMWESTSLNREAVLSDVVTDIEDAFLSISNTLPKHEATAIKTRMAKNRRILTTLKQRMVPPTNSDAPDKPSSVRGLSHNEDIRALSTFNEAVAALVDLNMAEEDEVSEAIKKAKKQWKSFTAEHDKSLVARGVNIDAAKEYALGSICVQHYRKLDGGEEQLREASKHFLAALDIDEHFGRAFGMQAYVLGMHYKNKLAEGITTSEGKHRIEVLLTDRRALLKKAKHWTTNTRARSITLNNLATVEGQAAEFEANHGTKDDKKIRELLASAKSHARSA